MSTHPPAYGYQPPAYNMPPQGKPPVGYGGPPVPQYQQPPPGPTSFTIQADDGWTGRKSMTLYPDGGTAQDSYVVKVNKRGRQHLTLHRGHEGSQPSAAAHFKPMSKSTVLTFWNQFGGEVEMKLGGIGSTGGMFVSKSNHVTLPAGPGPNKNFTWKGTTKTSIFTSGGELRLIEDATGREFAHFVKGSPSRLQIVPGCPPAMVEQIIMSSCAIWEKTRRDQRRTAGAAGGVSASGGGG